MMHVLGKVQRGKGAKGERCRGGKVWIGRACNIDEVAQIKHTKYNTEAVHDRLLCSTGSADRA